MVLEQCSLSKQAVKIKNTHRLYKYAQIRGYMHMISISGLLPHMTSRNMNLPFHGEQGS